MITTILPSSSNWRDAGYGEDGLWGKKHSQVSCIFWPAYLFVLVAILQGLLPAL